MDVRVLLVLIFMGAASCVQYRCDFEYPCIHWHWDAKTNLTDGFQLVTGAEVAAIDNYKDGPYLDYKQNNQSHFLLLIGRNNRSRPLSIVSNEIEIMPNAPNCRLQANLHVGNMERGMIRIVKLDQNISWVMSEYGDNFQRWEKYRIRVGTKSTRFRVVIEVDVRNVAEDKPVHLAIDNLEMVDCKPNLPEPREHCSDKIHLECMVNNTMRCLDKTQICDIKVDCDNGEDETQKYCAVIPKAARCSFETSCSWTNHGQFGYNWLNSSNSLIPEEDHTFGNFSGHFVYFEPPLKKDAMGGMAELRSPVFNRLPIYHLNETSGYYNTCHISFNYKLYGKSVGSLALYVVSLTRRENISTRIFWMYGDTGDTAWHRASVYLPTNITSSYLLMFEGRAGFRTSKENFCALDDIAISPLCFGYGVPDNVPKYPYPYDYYTIVFPYSLESDEDKEEERDNSYRGRFNEDVGVREMWEPDSVDVFHPGPRPDKYFETIQPYRFTTCKAKGYKGPNQMACNNAYNQTNIQVQVLDDKSGVQRWRVNNSNYYTVIAKGASGGRPPGDRSGRKTSGAILRTVMPFPEGEKLYIVVGQEGSPSCKSMSETRGNPMIRDPSLNSMLRSTQMRQVKDSPVQFHGGGGGGGTFMFHFINKDMKPLVISGGGGGLSRGTEHTDYQYGRGVDPKRLPSKGQTPKDPDSKYSAGAGGGWLPSANSTVLKSMDGHAVESGALGGESCKMLYHRETLELLTGKGKLESSKLTYGKTCGFGGFGGGGGGCSAGGGGGGYSGGDAYDRIDANGQGGFSYFDPEGEYTEVFTGSKGNAGSGEVIIIPAVKGCDCSFLCVALDEFLQETACVCQPDLILDDDNKTCVDPPTPTSLFIRNLGQYCKTFFWFVFFIVLCGFVFKWGIRVLKQRKLDISRRNKVASDGFGNSDIQLDYLRSNNVLSSFLRDNPTYEFSSQAHEMLIGLSGKDLVKIPRENLQLVKALGQGAFGEVYQGLYRQRSGDTVEMPVAVKTLPQVSSTQNESDFLMEACIMQNFKHPNIVRLLGVCFDQHPRYIVIELLAGGDLKNFLREGRPKPERPSPLTMKDLLLCAIDVAKGCKYLEDQHFVHRDIAARNCLLTTKGPGRTVKIADFGMARDIYRNDYYKKGGKAMLPIKWMPPEAFLDGIFSAMTDVWSFGVLLWEVMALGYMPYTGCTNREVMQLVKSGGRMEPPTDCPLPIYAIMTSCWNPDPEKRPHFGVILERLDYCFQDPDVFNAPLPVFEPAPEGDQAVMRPNTSQECLNMDYLIPLGPLPKKEERDNSNNSASCSPTSVVTVLNNIPPPIEANTDEYDINDIVDFTNIPPPKEYIDWSPQQAQQELVPMTIITNGTYNETDEDTEEEEDEEDDEEDEDESSTISEYRQWNKNPTYPHIKINADEDTTSVSDLNSPSSSDATPSTSTNQSGSNIVNVGMGRKEAPQVKFNNNGKGKDGEKRPPFTLSGTFVPDTEISC